MAAMSDARELNLTLDFCLRVGELLLSSGAGAADVTSAMQSLSWQLGARNPEVDVTFTSLSMSYQGDPEEPAFVLIRQVKQRDIDYEHLTRVDHLMRDVLNGDCELKEARTRLARIVSSGHTLPRWAVTLGWGAMCAGVGLQLGGDAAVMSIAFVAAVCIDRVQMVMARRRVPFFYRQVAGGGVATLIAVAVAATPVDLDLVAGDQRQHHHAAGRHRLHGRPPGRAVGLPRDGRRAADRGTARDRRHHRGRQRRPPDRSTISGSGSATSTPAPGPTSRGSA